MTRPSESKSSESKSSESKSSQPKSSRSADALAKASPQASVELSEAALDQTSGGAVFPSSPATNAVKLDLNFGLLLPAVRPGN